MTLSELNAKPIGTRVVVRVPGLTQVSTTTRSKAWSTGVGKPDVVLLSLLPSAVDVRYVELDDTPLPDADRLRNAEMAAKALDEAAKLVSHAIDLLRRK